MKKFINSILVIMLTFITVFVIFSYRVDNTIHASSTILQKQNILKDNNIKDDVGYTFEDYGMGINIQFKK